MSSRQRGEQRMAWMVGVVFLMGLLAAAVMALRAGDYAVPAVTLVGMVGALGAWGGLRLRSRSRMRAVWDAFAESELARRS